MKMTSDLDLLRRFTREKSQDAFSEIVRRHLNLVYSAALRQIRSPQLAEEIAQSVFADLARDAGKLKPDTILTAWLYSVTRRTAIDVVRKESRRQLREQIAVEMNNMNATTNEWTQIEPLLDDAMAALDETDRAAILLRYFENKNLREIGESLKISNDAAQKRVSRAVEKLREFFSKQKITIGASGLAVLISANAVQSAPVGLAATISVTAILAGTAVHTSTLIAATKTIAMTTLQKSIIGATFAVVAGTGFFEAHQVSQLREQNQILQQQQTPLSEQIRQWQQELNEATNQLVALQTENEQLKSNPNATELLKLRGEVTQLQSESRQNAQEKIKNENDSDELAAQAWVERVKLLKHRFGQWTGKPTPELQLLSEQDWLNEAANHDLTNDDVTQQAMADLRYTAKGKFADVINQALSEFAKSNNGQLPSDLSELKPYLQPPSNSILDGYEIAKPGWVHPPQPNSPNSKNAETWALVMKGSFTPDGIAIRNGSYLADPNYDMTVVIYNAGYYGYGPDKLSK